MTDKKPISYKDAGVDIEAGDHFVERIKKMVGKTYNDRVTSGVGGFASLYDMGNDRFLASGTDGVGTKLLLAQELGVHHTIGIDLVAMCVNDILCTGARPLFFLDYLACGKLDLEVQTQVMEGIVEGCMQSKMALIGGETAEMPGMYAPGHYDLAGFAVGEVHGADLLDGSKLRAGMRVIGVSSSGPHSNGYSLVRRLLDQSGDTELKRLALAPTKIYVDDVMELRAKHSSSIAGLAHITGGGFTNMARLSKNLDVIIEHLPRFDELPEIFTVLKERSHLDDKELYTTFNMGVGLAVMTDEPERVMDHFLKRGHRTWDLGHLTNGSGVTRLQGVEL
jgi:phosphoribosylformylglycinamidine cyclo-ligase